MPRKLEYTIFDYIYWRGDRSFAEAPFNNVDSLVLTTLSYIYYQDIDERAGTESGISLRELTDRFEADPKNYSLRHRNDEELLLLAGNSKRYGDVIVTRHVDLLDKEAEIQFSAELFLIDKNTGYICYRGTDPTLTALKEDLNLAFEVVPAQQLALSYLNVIGRSFKGKIYVGGHSKGGNMAVYASANCDQEVFDKILKVYNMDGPGFDASVIEKETFDRVGPKLVTYLPKSSIVGMMLEPYGGETFVIDSFGISIGQHEPFRWKVTTDDFVYLNELDGPSHYVKATLDKWLSEIPVEERKEFVEAMDAIMSASQAEKTGDVVPGLFKNFMSVTKVLRSMDDSTRKAVIKSLGKLFAAAGSSIPSIFKNESDH